MGGGGVLAWGVGERRTGPVGGWEAGAETVLVAGVQGSPEVREAHADDVGQALASALEARGYTVVTEQARGEALVSCGTPTCIAQTLEGAGASFGLVPAVWLRTGNRRELTLTLVRKSGRNLNAGKVIDGDLSRTTAFETTATLVDELLLRRSGPQSGAGGDLASNSSLDSYADEPTQRSARPHAWKTGPIVLWAGGAGVFVGIGAAAGMKDETEQLNKGAVAAWSVIGAAALAGGTAWWVVGQKRRQRQGERTEAALDTAIRVSHRGFDLRLRF